MRSSRLAAPLYPTRYDQLTAFCYTQADEMVYRGSRLSKRAAYLKIVRPKQWIKNLFVLAPLVFGSKLLSSEAAVIAIGAFVAFCLASSCVYVFNDLADVESDRIHPHKRNRPLASGVIPTRDAWILASLLAVAALALSVVISMHSRGLFTASILAYLLLNLFYSLLGKRMVIVDAFCISLGFVIRVIGGAFAVGVSASSWILVTTFFLALFMGFGKRRNEIVQLNDAAGQHRQVLTSYDQAHLDLMIMSTGTLAIISYALYSLDLSVILRFHTDKLVYTVPFVTFGIYRYMYLLFLDSEGDPTELITRDNAILLTVLLWVISMLLIAWHALSR